MADMEWEKKGVKDPGVAQILEDTRSLIEEVKSLRSQQELSTAEIKTERFEELMRAWETLESYQFSLREFQEGKRQLPAGYLDTYTQIAYAIIDVDQQMRALGTGYYVRFQRTKVEKLSEAIWQHGGDDADSRERRMLKEAVRNMSTAIPTDISADDARDVARFMRDYGTRL